MRKFLFLTFIALITSVISLMFVYFLSSVGVEIQHDPTRELSDHYLEKKLFEEGGLEESEFEELRSYWKKARKEGNVINALDQATFEKTIQYRSLLLVWIPWFILAFLVSIKNKDEYVVLFLVPTIFSLITLLTIVHVITFFLGFFFAVKLKKLARRYFV